MIPVKFCRDCKHHGYGDVCLNPRAHTPVPDKLDIVTGEIIKHEYVPPDCREMRINVVVGDIYGGTDVPSPYYCRYDANWFEPKPPRKFWEIWK